MAYKFRLEPGDSDSFLVYSHLWLHRVWHLGLDGHSHDGCANPGIFIVLVDCRCFGHLVRRAHDSSHHHIVLWLHFSPSNAGLPLAHLGLRPLPEERAVGVLAFFDQHRVCLHQHLRVFLDRHDELTVDGSTCWPSLLLHLLEEDY